MYLWALMLAWGQKPCPFSCALQPIPVDSKEKHFPRVGKFSFSGTHELFSFDFSQALDFINYAHNLYLYQD